MHVDVGQDYARRRRESWRQDQTEGGEAGLDFGHRIIAAINSAPVSQVKTREKLAAAQPSLSFGAGRALACERARLVPKPVDHQRNGIESGSAEVQMCSACLNLRNARMHAFFLTSTPQLSAEQQQQP